MSWFHAVKEWSTSLRAAILLAMTVGLGLPTIGLMLAGFSTFESEFHRQLSAQHETMLDVLVRGLHQPVWTLDQEEIRNQIEAFAKSDGILRVTLAPFNNDYLPLILSTPQEGRNRSTRTNLLERQIVQNGEIVAQLTVETTTDHARQRVLQVRSELQMAFGLLLLLVWGLMVALLYRRLLRPLSQLSQHADAVAGGDLDQSFSSRGTDEIAQVAASLDHMRQALKSHMRMVEAKNLALYDQLNENKAAVNALLQRDQDVHRLINLHDTLMTLLRGGQSHLDEHTTMDRAIQAVAQCAQCDEASLWQVDSPLETLLPLASSRNNQPPPINGFAVRAILRGFSNQDLLIADHIADHSSLSPLIGHTQWRLETAVIAAPIYLDGVVYGTLFLASDNRPWSDGDRQLAQMSATLIALLLEQGRRLRSENKLRVLSCAVEQSPAAVIITDPQGNIEYINPRFTTVTGYALDEVQGKSPSILRSPQTPAKQYKALWTTISAGGLWSGEMTNRRKDGSEYYVRSSISPIFNSDGQISHYVGIHDDVTEIRQREEELRQAKEQAEAGNHAKSMFLANTSHEIRTPLNAIIGMSHLALGEPLHPTVHTYVQNIHDAGQMLLRVINDILDFSKIEAGKLDLEILPFQLWDALQSVMKVVEIRAREKALDLSLTIDPSTPKGIKSDPARLSQVLINLIGNAVKFTERGSVQIHVSAGAVENNHTTLQIQVRDTGIGISREQQKLLFQPFSQADWSMARRFGGTGLGLSISRRLLELMGGSIRVDSDAGQGSTFTFTLPCQVVDAPAPRVSRAGIAAQSLDLPDNFRLLVAEDNDLNRQLVRGLLARAGITPDFAEDGSIALEMIEQAEHSGTPYDMVFMDVQMPIMDGIQATQAIRAKEHLIHLPIIALTAHALGEERERFLKAGMSDHLSKPIKPQDLYGKIQDWCSLRRQQTRQ